MRKIRTQVTSLFLALVVAGVAGTTFVTTRISVSDKRDYVMELNSIAAPNVAAAIAKRLDYLQDEFITLDGILLSRRVDAQSEGLALVTFRRLTGVAELDVLGTHGTLFSFGSQGRMLAAERYDAAALKRLASLPDRALTLIRPRSTDASPALVFSVREGGLLHLARLSPDAFSEYFDLARALSVSLVDDEGAVVFSNSHELGAGTGAALQQLMTSLHGLENEEVIAKQLDLPDGKRTLAAIAPLPRTHGIWILVQAPAAQVSQMVRQVVESSLSFVALVLALAAAVGVLFSARLVRPIENLTEATSAIATGNWRISISPRPRNEIGRLVDSFEKMGDELSRREIALKQAHEELLRSEKLATLGKFSAGLAHEVKNPLNTILGYSRLIQRQLGDQAPGEVPKFLGFIMDETRRASKIISDLLTFARQKPPALARVRVAEVLDRAEEMLAPQAAQSKAELVKAIDDPSLECDLDRDQIFQVILNLVQNALHALEEKPEGQARTIALRLKRAGDNAVIEVSDNGAGIAEENLSKLFQPFFSTKGVGKGTGLGLSMCDGIVHQHRGKIEVSSKLGEGTTFRVFLPLVQA